MVLHHDTSQDKYVLFSGYTRLFRMICHTCIFLREELDSKSSTIYHHDIFKERHHSMKENTGRTKYVILGMLARMPLTGYTIKKWIGSEYSHFWQESYGQIYPTLKKLVAEGLAVSSEDRQTGNKRGQIVYSITEAGREILSAWLQEDPDIEKLRYEILLKVSFGESTEPAVLLRHLDHFISRNEKLIAEMNHYIDHISQMQQQDVDCSYSQLTALCGVHLYTAMRDWALEAQKIIAVKKEGA